jgi:N-acetyl-gamma-glutamyl-phosphate reductase
MKIFVDGAVGTTGLEIGERLSGRPEIELITLPEAHRKDPAARGDALNTADIVILCLPDDAAREAVALLEGSSTRIIDASTAHRIAPGWAYGFPELEPIRDATPRASSPWCARWSARDCCRPKACCR